MQKYILIILALLSLHSTLLHAQGTLLVVGGGSESNDTPTSWSTQAYSWAVAQSANKKVAVIHYDNTGNWLKPYFTGHCGAVESKNFVINSSNANNAELMEELSGYDMFFFRGGDQYEYYTDYKGTLMETTMQEKFDEGGVLAGTSAGLAILSGVLFPATNGSAYSDVVVKNIDHSTLTLADDFLTAAPGLIFDSHFTDRGRMGRIIAFMASYEEDKGTRIKGIGVDETTAFGIRPNHTGIAFGTGGVHIYELPGNYEFGGGPALSFRNLRYTTLVHKDSISLETGQVWGMEEIANPPANGDYSGQKLFIAGAAELSSAATAMLSQYVEAGRGINDSILIVTGNPSGIASEVKARLESEGAPYVNTIEAVFSSANDGSLTPLIRNARKLFFVDNNTYNLNVFLASGVNGPLLNTRMREPTLIAGFMGDDARYAGEWTVTNYFSSNGSSAGTFSLSEGFALLDNFCIIPRTFDPPGGSTDNWGSTHAALPWAMVDKEVKNGVWLNNDNYIIVSGSPGNPEVESGGLSPVMFLRLSSPQVDRVSMTYNGTDSETPRMLAAYKEMHLSFLEAGQKFIPGVNTATPQSPKTQPSLNIFPNPVRHTLNIESDLLLSHIRVLNLNGQIMLEESSPSKRFSLPAGRLENGIYMLEARSERQVIRQKFIKLH